MIKLNIQIFLFITQLIIIFFLSRLTINQLFFSLRLLFKKEKTVNIIISLIFLPGTIVHEMGHLIAATVLGLQIHSIQFIPQFEKNQIKLGSVVFSKKDFIRGILVGVAPLFIALSLFWLLAELNYLTSTTVSLRLSIGYLIFVVSSTMFSSKRDLVDFIFVLPLFIIMIAFIYIFDIKISYLFNNSFIERAIIRYLTKVNQYLLIAMTCHFGLLCLLQILKLIANKR